MHEIFQDIQELRIMQNLGLTVRVFGSDLEILNRKIRDPWAISKVEDNRNLYVFVLISERCPDGSSTLHKDFRSNFSGKNIAEDVDVHEAQEKFPNRVAENITMLSRWMLCTPHLTGSLPGTVPGWIPIFNTRKCIALRTYISSYKEYKSRILYMDRALISRVFGCQRDRDLLARVSDLTAVCYSLQDEKSCKRTIVGRLSMNTIRNVYMPPGESPQEEYVVVNTIHPLNSAIMFSLP
ncbi:hypothetical protein BU23DRAFT_570143 [Bimuria novae-zelandiae CBS 107.79]|uniref:Uncharacterized protein n=1 Tax=Bimuria novae-zelandiae CBS 107.79 TaxID=1447943 RepID=A0A6A5V2B2_9PLEO|nr:hypothetical protein BU23DRAFT_570143 [Bimuria novae-zelandiae CBS 107.79]